MSATDTTEILLTDPRQMYRATNVLHRHQAYPWSSMPVSEGVLLTVPTFAVPAVLTVPSARVYSESEREQETPKKFQHNPNPIKVRRADGTFYTIEETP